MHEVVLEPIRQKLFFRLIGRGRFIVNSLLYHRGLKHVGPGSHVDRPMLITGGKGISVGARVQIWRGARLEAFNIDGADTRLSIGDETVIQPFVHIGAALKVVIGEGCLFASHVYISDHDHEWENMEATPLKSRKVICDEVHIGKDVWLGERVTVLKGVTIGERSIIGAGSIVTTDIPPKSVAVGSPARVCKQWCDKNGRWESV